MPYLRRWVAAVVTTILLISTTSAQEPIRFARTPDISPDGKQVAFSYLGDIWTVEAIGGVARPVTMHEAHDAFPVFSPDGRWIAFSSNRHGSYDVFVVAAHGGKPRRLTFDSAADLVTGWSPDGKQVLFASTRSTAFPPSYELFTVPFEGGRVRRVTANEGKEGVFSPKGDQIAYVRGPGTWYRKGYRGSSNDDVWICNADGTNNRRLTDFNGQDTSPMWSPDGQLIYYVSECCGNPANIVRQDVSGKSKPQQVTFHNEEGVRRARISANGEWIVYECGPDVWMVGTKGSSPRKLAIEVHADDKVNTERTVTLTRGATEYVPSPDERHIAFAVHGELFLMPLGGSGKATRLTDHPAYDHSIAWAPDGNKIIFCSDRNGHEDLYLLEPDDPDTKELVKAHRFKVTQLTDTPEPEIGPSFSPDGKRIVFIRAGKLWTMNPLGKDAKERDERVLVKDVEVFDYEWSPDSKWLAYSRADGSFASEVYIIPVKDKPLTEAQFKAENKNVTRYATYNSEITWSADGKKLAFISQRRQAPTMYVLSLQKPAAPGAPERTGFTGYFGTGKTPKVEIDWEDIHLRVDQPAPIAAEEGAISPDGSKVAFRSVTTSGSDLWVAATGGGQLLRVTTGNLHPHQIRWSRRGSDTLYFLDGAGQIRMARAGSLAFGEPVRVPFSAKLTIRRDEEFSEMFEQSWRALAEHFYDPKFHGANWDAVREKYRPLVKHVALKEDLYTLIALMMGELNASHLGISGFGNAPEEITADLGLLFDDSYRGPGLKIADVLKRGPADRRGIDLKPGQIVLAIDRAEVTDKITLSELLNGKVGEMVQLQVLDNPTADPRDPKAKRKRVEIQAVSRDQVHNLMYDRWVDHNAKRVAELSKGTLGYIHIPSMDEGGMDRFLRALYSDNFDKEAIVLDVRYNGGGFTHDQVLNYLGGKDHTVFRQRYGGEGAVLRSPDRKWTKPLVLLINNRSYSDAEIFPSAFRTLGLGKLVGQPTGGHVIGTYATRLIDGSIFRVPRTGVYTVKGVNMEKEGVVPDLVVQEHPDQLAKGIDPQLDKAVEVLQQDVATWKKSKSGTGVALQPAESKPATNPPPPSAGPRAPNGK